MTPLKSQLTRGTHFMADGQVTNGFVSALCNDKLVMLYEARGVIVMINFFGDVRLYSTSKLVFFLERQCYDPYFAKKTSSFLSTKANFLAQFFGGNILKIKTSVRCSETLSKTVLRSET
jgi:hypothetical protein